MLSLGISFQLSVRMAISDRLSVRGLGLSETSYFSLRSMPTADGYFSGYWSLVIETSILTIEWIQGNKPIHVRVISYKLIVIS